MFIDTHSHLNFKAFKIDYAQAIERAFNCDVKKIIIPGSNLETSKKAVKIAKEYENVFAAVGLHPIHIDETFNEEDYLKLAKSKKVIAIGETGLDYYHDRTNAEFQKEVFGKHLKLASRLNLPVIIHCREAGDDILSILTGQNPLLRGVFHCFSENWSYAQIVLEMGFYLSFTGIITFTKNQETFEVIKNTPLEKILIETDSPYLTPESHRGERNEPAYVVEVAKKIAELKKIPVDVVAEQTSKNAIELFKI